MATKTKPAPKKPKARWITVTPEKAAKLLESRNERNRKVQKSTVNRYASDMLSGKWRATGDPIRSDENGRLIDGHHRLEAAILSGKSFETLLIEGLSRQAVDAIDVGKSRSLADHIKFRGGNYSARAAAITRAAIFYQAGTFSFGSGNKLSNVEMLDFYSRHSKRIDEAARFCSTIDGSNRIVRLSSASAGLIYFQTKKPKVLVEQFLTSVATGEMLKKNSPEYVLHRWLRRESDRRENSPTVVRFAVMVKAWNAYALGQEMKIVRFDPDEKFPTIV